MKYVITHGREALHERRKKNKSLVNGMDADIDIYKFYREYKLDLGEKCICAVFGCGKTLSPQEKLFGNRCQQHQKKEKTLSIIDKYLSL